MTLWNVNLHDWAGTNFKEIRPERVLVRFDEPLTFTFRDASNNLMLAHLSADDDEVTRHIVVPVSDNDVERLFRGTISLRGVLDRPLVWVLDSKNESVLKSWCGSFSDIPTNAVPTEDAMLFPVFEPLIKLRVPDVRYRFGAVAVGALRYVIDSAESAVRTLLSHLQSDNPAQYELEAQQLAFNSIEIAFKPSVRTGGVNEPVDPKDKTFGKVEKLLTAGLKWVSSRGEHKLGRTHEKAILTAVRELTPKKDSQILKIEVSGRVLQESSPVALTTATRIDITERIKAKRPQSIDRTGIIKELDEDARTFELRDVKGRNDKPVIFLFSPDQHDMVYRCLGRGNFVAVSGEKKGNRYRLVDIVDEAD